MNESVLKIFDFNKKKELYTDASSRGYGAMLFQRQDDKMFHPVFYFSVKTTDSERNYHSFELETLAIVKALERFRVYLKGKLLVIVTDCAAPKQMLKFVDGACNSKNLIIQFDIAGGDQMHRLAAVSVLIPMK